MVRECGLTAYLLVREGLGVEARLVRLKDRGPWTHVGLIVGGTLFESVPSTERTHGGVRVGRLAEFSAAERAVSVGYVPISLVEPQCQNLFRWCQQQVKAQIPFDDLYNLEDDRTLYCTEFVYKAFLQIHINLLSAELSSLSIPLVGKRKVIFPRDLIGMKPVSHNLHVLNQG